jgi:tRNA(fMet)-specific endonuclease VapC
MAYLLDTNICVAAMNRRSPSVRDAMAAASRRGAMIGISTVVLFELAYGAHKGAHVNANTRMIRNLLAGAQIVPVDSDDAWMAGQIRADLEGAGTPMGAYDYLIAGQAVRRGMTLVTANVREFARVPGLDWENWAE